MKKVSLYLMFFVLVTPGKFLDFQSTHYFGLCVRRDESNARILSGGKGVDLRVRHGKCDGKPSRCH